MAGLTRSPSTTSHGPTWCPIGSANSIGALHERRCRPRPGPRPGLQRQEHRPSSAGRDAGAGHPDRRQARLRHAPRDGGQVQRGDGPRRSVPDHRHRRPGDARAERAVPLEGNARCSLGKRREALRPQGGGRATSCCSRSSTTRRTRRRPRSRTPSTASCSKLNRAWKGFGRIAAQTAKQVILQRVREAERENVFNQYKDRKGELISGIVRRFERGNIIVDLGGAEAVLPVREQVPRESYRAGDRIVAYVVDIDKTARGPQIILSRTHKGLLEKLFEMEVPEIYEKIVRIEASAREPGRALEDRGQLARSRRRSGGRLRRHEGLARAGGRAGAARREDRHRPLRSRSGALRVQRDRARRGGARHHRRREPHDGADRPRRQAVAGHRQEGPERAPGVAADRLAHRHPLGVEGARDGGARAPVAGRDQEWPATGAVLRRRPSRRCSRRAGARRPRWRAASPTSWRRSPASAAGGGAGADRGGRRGGRDRARPVGRGGRARRARGGRRWPRRKRRRRPRQAPTSRRTARDDARCHLCPFPPRTCIGCRRRGPAARDDADWLRRRVGRGRASRRERDRGGARRCTRGQRACEKRSCVRKCSRAPSNDAWPVQHAAELLPQQQLSRLGVERDETMMGSGYERTNGTGGPPAGPRLRVYELAKDLNVQPKDLVAKIRAMGIDVANHMSHLEPADVDRVTPRRRARAPREPRRGPAQRHRHPPPLEERRPALRPVRARLSPPRLRARTVRPQPPRAAASRPPRPPVAPVERRKSPPPRRSREGAGPAARPSRSRAAARGSPAAAVAPPRRAAPAPTTPPAETTATTARPAAAAAAPRRAEASPLPAALKNPAAGRHRFGRDGRVHPAARTQPRGETAGPRFEIKDRDEELRRSAAPRHDAPPGRRRRPVRPAAAPAPAAAPGGVPKKRVAAAGKKLKQTQITTPGGAQARRSGWTTPSRSPSWPRRWASRGPRSSRSCGRWG